MIEKIVTIGVYGTTEASFFGALQDAKIELFCDIRQRRGVRGSLYTYANSNSLQTKLAERNIDYLHLIELAPTQAIREALSQRDKQRKIAKRQRTALDDEFIQAFEQQVLDPFNVDTFLEAVGEHQKICFFCVECAPDACHRSLVALKLSQVLNIPVEHLTPCQESVS
jgi:uncharacterized protein (DUF488 family)